MSENAQFNVNLGKLNKLRSDLNQKIVAEVGILADGKAGQMHEGNITNLYLGIVQMFGSVSQNIPPRDFILMPIETKKQLLLDLLKRPEVANMIMDGQLVKVMKLLGEQGDAIIQSAFDTGGFGKWAPLKPSTIKRKGSSAILINEGQLRRSITSAVRKQ